MEPADRPSRAEHHHRHRRAAGGLARAAVFGVSDGLVSNVSLVVGMAAAGAGPSIVRATGIAGSIAGAASMAAGEWVSVTAQNDLVEREVAVERRELRRHPKDETLELAEHYERQGMSPDTAATAAREVMTHDARALQVHALAELGVDPSDLASPWRAAGLSLICFLLGALLPVVPWFGGEGRPAAATSVVIGVVAAAIVGALIARLAERSIVRGALRQVFILVLAVSVTSAIGSLLGVTTS